MLRILALCATVVALITIAILILRPRETPKRKVVSVLERLDHAIRTGDANDLLATIVPPSAVAERSATEQMDFLQKALREEISEDGIRAVASDGRFGPLSVVFSNEANRWAAAAGVKGSDCAAFRLARNGLVAEVVILTNSPTWRVIRCNNVAQMAGMH